MTIEKILIVDDEPLVREFLAEALRRKNYEIATAENGRKALSLLKDTVYDLVITDMRMPDLTGLDIIRKVKEISPQTMVIVITAYGSVENAVESMRLGAFNYLIKPFSPDSIETLIEKAKEHTSLVAENSYLRHEMAHSDSRKGIEIIGESPAIKKILAEVDKIAKTNATVFITGESGTGKEVIAQAIHFGSLRTQKPFIRVNCAAIPDTLIESEFFGHEKGAFTGANARRQGRFELADKGTLLLDEVTEIPLGLQAKLLRVIQEQEFERVGGSKAVKVDVRLISTSNRNMKEAIEQKVLREDLFYRLNVVPIYLPPLRDRKEDILPLAQHFLKKMCVENHKELLILATNAQDKLLGYNWPGNVRELANIVERAVVTNMTGTIQPEDLYIETSTNSFPQKSLKDLERAYIIETLQAQKNNRTKTAEVLGISLKTLKSKLEEYDISAKE